MSNTLTTQEFKDAFDQYGSVKAVSRNLKITYWAARQAYHRAVQEGLVPKQTVGCKRKTHFKPQPHQDDPPKPVAEGWVNPIQPEEFGVPRRGVRRHLFTVAQNNTEIHEPLWRNLNALAAYYEADIHVARTTYIKTGLGARGDKAQVTKKEELYGAEDLWWDERLKPYFSDHRAQVAPGLLWCGEMNILPTAVNPLSGLEVYTGRQSAIFPHNKLALNSVPSLLGEPAKFNYTTGTVTKRNYIQRKTGLKADFHHSYGALLVEVDPDGDWFCRQIIGDSNGTIHDLDVRVQDGKVEDGHGIEAIVWGDVHVANGDQEIFDLAWGRGGMLDRLRPKYQFLHDVLDWRVRSHHEIKNPHKMFQRLVDNQNSAEQEIQGVVDFLRFAQRPWLTSVVVDSNHHRHMARWLQEQNGLNDPVNAEFWIRMQGRVYRAIREGRDVQHLREAVHEVLGQEGDLGCQFLPEDASFVVCPQSGGIECGLHGDRGPHGSRGSARNLARMGRKAVIADKHVAEIHEGVYVVGVSCRLAPDWAHGPSAWSHTHCVIYPNGKRALVTMWNGKWRARSNP